MNRLICIVVVLVALVSVVIIHDKTVYAARSSDPGVCGSDDNNLFPYGFMCGTAPQLNSPIVISATWNGNPLSTGNTVFTPAGGTTVQVKMSWGHTPPEPFVTGDPKRNGDLPAKKSLAFVTVNNASPQAEQDMLLSNPSSGGVVSKLCPGADPGSSLRPGKIWGNRDTTGNYGNGSTVNGNNQSAYAYDGSSQGVVNCQDSGRMAYWIDDSPSRAETYTFDINIEDTLDSPTGNNNCIRGDLAIRFENDGPPYNQFGADDHWFPPNSVIENTPPQSGGGAGVLTPAENSRITATHIVKNSPQICFNVKKPNIPRPDSYWTGTLNATCDPSTGAGTISGRITKYNNNFTPNDDTDDNVILPRPDTAYNLQVQDPGNGSWSTIGSGSTTPTAGAGNLGSEYSVSVNGAALFGSGVQRNFRLEHPGGAGWDYVYNVNGGFYRGASLDCVSDPPVVSASANCKDGISVNVSDPDSFGNIHVVTRDESNNVVDDRYTLGGTFLISYEAISRQDGNDHSFSVVAADDSGNATGPVPTGNVTGCGKFILTPSAGGAGLVPTDENPSSFDATTSVVVTYPGWANPTHPAVPGSSQNTITKNGANVGGPYPSDTSFTDRNYAFSYPISSLRAGDAYCSHIVVGPAEGLIEAGTGTILRVDRASDSRDSGCQPVVNEPYVHVLGSDASAGGGFGSNCTTVAGGIQTYNKGNGGTGVTPGGSGAQIGALSITPSTGFSSAMLRNIPPTGYTGLTFSNTSNNTGGAIPKPNTGGDLGGNNCVSDYFGKMPSALAAAASTTNSISGNRANPGGAFTQVSEYYEPIGGTLTISGGTIDDGVNAVIYVKGNVVITGNIAFTNTSWAGLDKVPSLYIIAKGGNIYIQPSVSRLDGLFVSQPTAAVGGSIYTCASGTTGYVVANINLLSACNNQLVVNGSFISQKVYLSRSYGSLRSSYPGERMKPLNQSCGLDSGSTTIGDCAAEIFNFSPEAYLSQPAVTPNTGPTTGKYDYVTSLAPVL